MDSQSLRKLVAEGPTRQLLDAIDGGHVGRDILPLLEAELQRSSARLQRLKEQRNSIASPIYCLQPETLSTIFSIYAEENGELYNLRWTRLLLVCRRWYDIASAVKSLWSFIDISGPNVSPSTAHGQAEYLRMIADTNSRDVRRIEAQLSRVGLWPLSINMAMHGHLSQAKRNYTSMSWNTHSLYSLIVSGEHSCIDNMISSVATRRHAYLRTLTLTSNSDDPSAHTATRESLNVLLKDNTPNLRHLSLSALQCDLTLLRELQTLRISYLANVPTCLTLPSLIVALDRCPRLESLHVTLPRCPQLDDGVLSITVPMSHLSTIVVQSTVPTCTALLNALTSVPNLVKLLVNATEPEPDSLATLTSIFALSSAMSKVAHKSYPTNTVRSVAITQLSSQPTSDGDDNPLPFPARSRLGLVGRRCPVHRIFDRRQLQFLSTHENEELSCIGIETETSVNTENEVLNHIMQCWPLEQTTHLDLRIAPISSSYLGVLIDTLPRLTTAVVDLDSTNLGVLLHTLRARLRKDRHRPLSRIVFDASAVNHYALWRRGFSGRILLPPEIQARRDLMHALAYCAEAANAGMPLDTVELMELQGSKLRLINPTADFDWRELCDDLNEGFIYGGVLHSGKRELDGMKRDSF